MTNQDIERMAEEADLWADQELQCIGEYHPDWHEIRDRRFAALVAASEREAFFKGWERYGTYMTPDGPRDLWMEPARQNI